MQAHTDSGNLLQAAFSVEPLGEATTVVLESASGRSNGVPRRNPDYNDLLELLLRRLARAGCSITDILVDSGVTAQLGLGPDERRVRVADRPYPIRLDGITDFLALRRAICAGQSKVGRRPESTKGNFTRRIRVFLTGAGGVPSLEEYLATGRPLPSPPDAVPIPPAPRRASLVERVVRDTAVTAQVKALHGHRCQVCGLRLETPAGFYAEAAHVRPLGSPHDGPDVPENVLCLCPNHHVLFDYGAFAVADDLGLIGLEGRLAAAAGHWVGAEYIRYHRERVFTGQAGAG